MKNTKTLIHAKTLSYALFGVTLLQGANSYAAVSQSPLSLTVGVPPNMILTLDNSGSMTWAFSPDELKGPQTDRNAAINTRRGKSNTFNAIYFNPQATYPAPRNGSDQQLSTTFSNAWVNGFKTNLGGLDLSNEYRATWAYDLASKHSGTYAWRNTDNSFGENPSLDFTASTYAANGTQVITRGELTYRFTRRNNSSCSVTVSHSDLPKPLEPVCNVTSNWGSQVYSVDLRYEGVPAYYYAYDPSLTNNCSASNDDCYKLRFVTADQQQNFANWYSFYRNRALATISAASVAFYNLSPSVRLSWQSLAGCQQFDGKTNNCKGNAFQEFSASHRTSLFNWMQNLQFSGGTPLQAAMKRAGEFYKTPTPWEKTPNGSGNSPENTYACRASYHILMTDGIWGGTDNPSSYRQDSDSFTLPDNKKYTGQAPFYSDIQETLADQAMHYWATDLRPQLANKVPAYTPFKNGSDDADYWDPRNDPATWQHMTNFVMGLGLTQSLSAAKLPWEGSTHSGTGYEALKKGQAWPKLDDTGKVYDLWHAAINSRGEFFSVDSPEAMVQAFADILSRIADRKSTAARPAINSGQVADENVTTVSYQSSYASDDNWSGDIKRFDKTWDPETKAIVTKQMWSAQSNVPAVRTSIIKVANSANNLINFSGALDDASYAGKSLRDYLNINPEKGGSEDGQAAARLSYLIGDRSGEGSTFRQRSGLLGDFYSSTPVVVSKARYLPSVANRLEGNDAYTEFAKAAQTRKARVYAGSNDGMLHGFNAATGVEEFAFVPSAVFPKLSKLTGTNYSHEFYVDGSPVVGDVYDGKSWRTILVGTLRAGGKSVFALDITTPGSEKLLWQFDDNSITNNNAVKMGYSFSQPTIARLHTGKWGVVFGNGYEAAGNANGKAALFILDAVEGTVVRSLEVQGTKDIANGLSTPRLADINGDGVADYAYAGDLQGNMWRFDLLRAAASNGEAADKASPFKVTNDVDPKAFRVGYGGRSLFSATSSDSSPANKRQAITAAPSIVRHPTGQGQLVVFGTGRFFDGADKEGDRSSAQSVYGIWDKQTLGETGTNATVTRGTLQQQELTTGLTASDGTNSQAARTISNNKVSWLGANAQNGWFLNLIRSDGEMVVENMSQLGNTLFLQSLVPNADPCGNGASNWTYAINPFTGGKTAHNAFDYVTSDGASVSAIKQDGEGGGTISQDPDGNFQFSTGQSSVNIYPDPTSIGRQSWRRVDEQESN